MRSYEEKVFQLFDKIVTVSDNDRHLIQQTVPDTNVTVIDNGVDTEYFKQIPGKEKDFCVVFTGSLDWFPNEDAMMYFIDEIWPLVLRKFSESRFTIVGRNPSRDLLGMVEKNQSVNVTGTTPDVRPFIDEAVVYAVPLRVGGGSRLKILEAFAMCKPVISTTIGAEGLDVCHQRDILIADSPQEFAEGICQLMVDSAMRHQIARKGHALVKKKHEWKHLARKLEQVWDDTACKRND